MSRKIKFIYLASPFSAKGKLRNFIELCRERRITSIAAELTLQYGYAMFLPITQSYQLRAYLPKLGTSFSKWKKIDLCAIEHSDEVWVVMMPRWKESIGVT